MTKNIKEGRPKVSLVLSKQRKRQQNQTSQKKLFWSFEKKDREREVYGLCCSRASDGTNQELFPPQLGPS